MAIVTAWPYHPAMTIRIAALVLSFALCTQAPLAARASPVDFPRLAGRWKVTAVSVGPGVGALAQDDPAYRGQILTIGTDRLAWENGTKPPPGAMLDDRCEGPVTAHQNGAAAENYRREHAAQLKQLRISRADPYAVECNEGQWGPEAAGGAILFPAPGGRLAMTWYDGGILLLERVR